MLCQGCIPWSIRSAESRNGTVKTSQQNPPSSSSSLTPPCTMHVEKHNQYYPQAHKSLILLVSFLLVRSLITTKKNSCDVIWCDVTWCDVLQKKIKWKHIQLGEQYTGTETHTHTRTPEKRKKERVKCTPIKQKRTKFERAWTLCECWLSIRQHESTVFLCSTKSNKTIWTRFFWTLQGRYTQQLYHICIKYNYDTLFTQLISCTCACLFVCLFICMDVCLC